MEMINVSTLRCGNIKVRHQKLGELGEGAEVYFHPTWGRSPPLRPSAPTPMQRGRGFDVHPENCMQPWTSFQPSVWYGG